MIMRICNYDFNMISQNCDFNMINLIFMIGFNHVHPINHIKITVQTNHIKIDSF